MTPLRENISSVLVTGGAGFIGSHLVPSLLDRNYSVVVLDNLSSGTKENLQSIENRPGFIFIRGDVRNLEDVKKAAKDVDAILHLAALIDVSASVADPLETFKVNVTGTLNLLQEAVKRNIQRFVLASSTAVYGDPKAFPIKEESPIQPISPYAASKAAAEAFCSAYAGCYMLDTVRLRFFNVYGPRNENSPYSGVITKFLRKALVNEALTIEGDGEQNRDFIHVEDVVQALIAALEGRNLRGEAFNICTGRPTSVNGLAEIIRDVAKKELRITHNKPRIGDIRFSYGDPSKAASMLGFRAKIDLRDGIKLLTGPC